MADTQIQQLICNFLTQAQYDALVLAGTVNQNEMYYVTDAKEGANNITITPVGNITATNVQAAIEELDSEKQAAGNYVASTDALNIIKLTTAEYTALSPKVPTTIYLIVD